MFYLHCQIEIMLQSTLNQRPRVKMVVCLVNIFMYSRLMMYCYLWFSINIEKNMGSLFIHFT